MEKVNECVRSLVYEFFMWKDKEQPFFNIFFKESSIKTFKK